METNRILFLILAVVAPHTPIQSQLSSGELFSAKRTNADNLIGAAYALSDDESRSFLYHAASNGGLLSDVYKDLSLSIPQNTFYYLDPKELPTLYQAIYDAIPPQLREHTTFFLFATPQPYHDPAWSKTYPPHQTGKHPQRALALPITESAFEQLSTPQLQNLIAAQALMGLLQHRLAQVVTKETARRSFLATMAFFCTAAPIGVVCFLFMANLLRNQQHIRHYHSSGNDNGLLTFPLLAAGATGALAHQTVHDIYTHHIRKRLHRHFALFTKLLAKFIASTNLHDGMQLSRDAKRIEIANQIQKIKALIAASALYAAKTRQSQFKLEEKARELAQKMADASATEGETLQELFLNPALKHL